MSEVTFLIPVYNGEKFLSEALESVENQTFNDFEVLIINDGSTDDTQKIIDQFTSKDKRFRSISRENRGLIKTLNEGLDLIETKYVARMDADDICHPQRLELQFKFMEENPDVGICGSHMHMFGNVESDFLYPSTDKELKAKLLFSSPFCHPSVIIRKEILDEHQLRYDEYFKDCEDYKLWLDLAQHTKFANLPYILLNYRRHGESVSDLSSLQEKGTQLVRRLAVSKYSLSQESVQFHLDLCSQRYDQLKLEYWPVYLQELKSVDEVFLKVATQHFRIYCQTFLPEEHSNNFLSCVLDSVNANHCLASNMR